MKRTLYEWIDKRGFKKSHVCERACTTPATLIRWNEKKTRPSKNSLIALLETLDINEDELDIKEK